MTAGFAGFALPALALLAQDSPPGLAGPVLAIGLMGAGMIAAAIAGRLWAGVALALLAATGLMLLALGLGLPAPSTVPPLAFALVIASVSFAARGLLFARSAASHGWWIAVAVVGGEAALVATASAQPGVLPAWLLALLPAQWATRAIQTSLSNGDPLTALPVLLALGGTAITTLLVAALWPRRWPYTIMFSAWLGLSALVHHHQTSPAAPASAPATWRSGGVAASASGINRGQSPPSASRSIPADAAAPRA
ncbi:hypothetical protein [Erythrobacter tepidarius]|uniref:hypothetical protein n=1 Tax=Erythrobacter tepidarius TaxID=60454 RepID=UPI001B80E254|nr:hypothetical protein [Erythrobacter tepidarius]